MTVGDRNEGAGADRDEADPTSIKKGKGGSLRRRLALTLIGVTLLSVLFLGFINYGAARSLLTNAVEEQLSSRQAARTQAIGNELAAAKGQVAAVAADRSLVTAVNDLAAGYEVLSGQPDLVQPSELAALEDYYQKEWDAAVAAGYEPPPLDQLVPTDPASRYLQYHYIVENPFPAGQRSELVAADDPSAYTMAHSEHHGSLAETANRLGADDLLLIASGDDARIVYSTAKRIDFGTELGVGPYRDTLLAEAVKTQLATVPAGEAVLVDFEPYVPASGEPVMFVASAIRDQTEVVGAVAVAVPVDRINAVTTAGGAWKDIGLGDTGETYVVGGDRLMRSDSRLWLEDPEEYQKRLGDADYPAEVAATIVRNGSTVLAQPVETESVLLGLEGKRFEGSENNYLDDKTLTVAGPLGVDELDWVVVAGLATSEAANALNNYLWGVLLAALILVPIVGVVAVVVANQLTRPVQPVVETAERVADGDLDAVAPDLGRNEYGDLANRINHLTAQLRDQEAVLHEQEQEITEVLLAALPPRLVDEVRKGDQTLSDVIDTATVIAFSVSGLFDEANPDDESGVELSSLLSQRLETAANRLGIERVRSSSDEHLFTAGLRTPEIAADEATQFIEDVRAVLADFAEETGALPTYRAGLSAGEVATGIQAGNQLSFGVWGDPPRIALALNAVAAPGQVLLDESVASALGPAWELEPAVGLLDLTGDPIDASILIGRRRAESITEGRA